ncbi:dihydropteroate synthase [Cognatiyoonia sediminum]|uniref:Dihydropteroate synthase n=1 Tax=Cognatiyoonia sediminum TaxID=1508389 RepID=A0A1M5MZQ4_9RHOB|nr:dihydropteroate synthase [Cognatiyoonia sediminum]SHG82233.1 dihydropteroate synthase [Cognatiyoonia sediminum]
MSKAYFRPIVRTEPARPKGAQRLAGGWCWFDQVVVLIRNGASEIVAASEVSAEILGRLTASRADLSGLSFHRPHLMGILNVTPDSFSDGGEHASASAAVERSGEMIADGVSIVDVGGESTRPGADFVPSSEEINRTFPPIAQVRTAHDVAISIDTRKADVAEAAVKAGASMINDVSGLSFDDRMAETVAASGLPVCIMHAQGDPKTMQDKPEYDDVLLDVYDYLEERIEIAVAAGIGRTKIIVDPGIGFGKTLVHNLQLLEGISLFHGLGCPILLGASRKRFIGTLGNAPDAADRLGGSVAVSLFGVNQGVQILRVHDTFATKQAIDLHMAMIGASRNDA